MQCVCVFMTTLPVFLRCPSYDRLTGCREHHLSVLLLHQHQTLPGYTQVTAQLFRLPKVLQLAMTNIA